MAYSEFLVDRVRQRMRSTGNIIEKKMMGGLIFIVNDKMGTPTYTHDFAKNVNLLIEKEYWGLYNLVCGGLTSRLEVTRELISIVGLEKGRKLNL